MKNTGKNIKFLRTEKGYNQKELGELLGVSQTSIAHYEAGTREPNIETLKLLSGIFNQTIDAIIGNTTLLQDNSKEVKEISEINSDLIDALLIKDDNKVISLFQNNIIGVFDLQTIIEEIISTVLYKIGDLWYQGVITEADEHYATNQMRKVVSFMSVSSINQIKNRTAITMSIGSEKHTLGIEIVNMYLESIGVKTIYLGNSVPYKSFATLIEEYKPDYIFLSITLNENINHLMALVDFIVSKFGTSITIGLGGQATPDLPKNDYNNVHIVPNLKGLVDLVSK